MRLIKYYTPLILLTVLLISPEISKGQNSEVTVRDAGWGKVDIAGFTLNSKAKIKIKGTGVSYNRHRTGEIAYGWILDSDSRRVVWTLLENDEFDHRGRVEDFKDEIELDKGNYETYFITGSNNYENSYDFGDLLEDIFTLGKRHRNKDRDESYYMTVSGPSNIFTPNDGMDIVDKKSNGAVVSIIRSTDDLNVKKGFTLSGDAKLHVYALGESSSGDRNDYGWITDVRTNKRVWVMDNDWTKNAGGAKKNVYVNEDITLPAGSYMVHYVTDDSHSFKEWNALPPNDPQFWGITIWGASKEDYAKVRPFREEDIVKPFVDLTKVRNDEEKSKGFSLPIDMDLRILCLGEGSGNDMADYGWIINADTRETVWRMEKDNTEHAGGANKNRMIDETIHFDKGNYIAYYTTDDSHAYRDWNDTPPFDPEQWGISIWTANENDAKKIKFFNEDDFKSKNVIAQIVKVRDDENRKKSFTLDKETKIRIYAIGEGTGHELADYGWIENKDTGKTVWEMTYHSTENAGGASKNRMFNGTIVLPRGTYVLYYETDGSHSYRDWNDTPPRDPDMYGITLYYE